MHSHFLSMTFSSEVYDTPAPLIGPHTILSAAPQMLCCKLLEALQPFPTPVGKPGPQALAPAEANAKTGRT